MLEFNNHEMNNLDEPFSRNRGSTSDCSGNGNGPCIKAMVCLLALVTLTLAVAGCWFVARFVQDGSIHSAIWAFFIGAISSGITSLFILHLSHKLVTWHDRKTLQGIKLFGMLMSAFSIVSTVGYIIAGAVAQLKNTGKGEDLFISALFSGLCIGCSFLLYITAQWYQNNLPLQCDSTNVLTSRLEPRAVVSSSRLV